MQFPRLASIAILAAGLALATPVRSQQAWSVYISVDFEGLAGIGTDAMTNNDGKDYAVGRRLMTDQVNAVIAGVRAAPAERRIDSVRIVVNDSHGDHANVLIEELADGVEYVQGSLIMQGGQLGQVIGPPVLALMVSMGGGWKSAPWLLGGAAAVGVALSLGLATTLVMALASTAVATVRNFIPHAVRIPVFILIIATLVTIVDLLMHAYVLELYKVLGIFIPLIVVNCIVLARVEAFASKRSISHSFLDGLMMGLGLTLVLAALGAMREIFGKGTLLSGIDPCGLPPLHLPSHSP